MDSKRGDGHNFTEECRDPTLNLQHCMEEHRDYYQVGPLCMPCKLFLTWRWWRLIRWIAASSPVLCSSSDAATDVICVLRTS